MQKVEEFFKQNQSVVPLNFQQVTCGLFLGWAMNLTRPDGSSLSFSALNGHRAALTDLFRQHGEEMSSSTNAGLSERFQALKRTQAKVLVNSNSSLLTGKVSVSFDFYSFLGKKILSMKGKEFIFGHTFMFFFLEFDVPL